MQQKSRKKSAPWPFELGESSEHPSPVSSRPLSLVCPGRTLYPDGVKGCGCVYV